jgi:hypothetical protein
MWVKLTPLIGGVIAHLSARSSFDKNEVFGQSGKRNNNSGKEAKIIITKQIFRMS